MKMMKINEAQRGAVGNYMMSRLLTASASAIRWQTTETPSLFAADSKMSSPPAAWAAAAACKQEFNERRRALDAAAAMRSNAPQNQPAFAAARVKHTAHASTGTTSAAHSTARAPLQPHLHFFVPLQHHLHFLHATPRHTLHHHLSPAPRHVRHVHIGRRSGQSLARERHAAEHEAHSPTRRTFRDNAAEGRQRLLPTVMRKKTLVAFDELERAHDCRAKLFGRLQLAIGDEGK